MNSPDSSPTVTPQTYAAAGWGRIFGDYNRYMAMTMQQRSDILNAIGVHEMERILNDPLP